MRDLRSRTAHLSSHRGLVTAAELGVIPAGDVFDLEDNSQSFRRLSFEERQRRIAERRWAVVLHPDCLADLEDLVVVIDDDSVTA